jgi:RNA polymerase sigma factor (sigma-70 family)
MTFPPGNEGNSRAATASPPPRTAFATTRWSMVLQAGAGSGPAARRALAELCQIYWYPLYAHSRRCGHPPHDAQDLTQAFFARLLERRALGRADPARGRFRSFMLTALNHFLADERDRARAQKRGGGGEVLSLDLAAAEARYNLEPADTAAPDRAFDRQWALALLDTVLRALETEYRDAGRTALFAALRPALAGAGESQPYEEIARRLGMSEGAVKVAVHRLRKRYRALLQGEIVQTVENPAEAAEEMRYLFQALSGE